MTDLAPLPETPRGRYRHYKGGEYEVIGAARHSETLEPLVVYRPLYNASGLWVRPHAMFFGQVDVDGRSQPRFTRIADSTGPSIERTWFARSPEGVDHSVSFKVAAPVCAASGEWSAEASLSPLDEPRTIFGEDAWQAVSLAMRFLADRARAFSDRGWQFFWTEGGERATIDDLSR